MDTLSLTKVKSLFILTLIQRDDGQKKQRNFADYSGINGVVCINRG